MYQMMKFVMVSATKFVKIKFMNNQITIHKNNKTTATTN